MHRIVLGNWYHVVYQAHRGNGQWYEWELTAKALGVRNDFGVVEHHFDLRPEAGTAVVPDRDIISVTPAAPLLVGGPPLLPRRVQGGRSGRSNDA
jgi:hypothetical protein